jgi:hypothetical protein
LRENSTSRNLKRMPGISYLSTNSMTLAESANMLVAFSTLTISRPHQVSRLSRLMIAANSRSHSRTSLLPLLPEIQSSTALASSRRYLFKTVALIVRATTGTKSNRKNSLSAL